MKKTLKILLVVILILFVIILTLPLFIGPIVTGTVNTVGPKMTQSKVTLDDFDLNILTGKGSMKKLFVGNPEGFDTPSAIELEHIKIKLKPHTLLFGKAIIIEEVFINAPEITLEGLTGKNLQKISENIAGEKQEEEEEEKEKGEKKKDGKRVIIEHLVINDIKIKYNAALTANKTLNISLPDIEMKDIGKEKEETLVDIVQNILGAILGTFTDVVGKGIGVTTDGVKGLGNIAGGALKAIGNTVTGKEDNKDEKKGDLKKMTTEGIKSLLGGDKKEEKGKKE